MLIRRLAVAACAAFLVVGPASAAGLSAAETKMAVVAKEEHDRSLALLEKLVNVNSGTLNLAGVEQVGRMMRAELEPLGFQVRWAPMKEVGRAGHLIATHKGSGKGRRMLLIGHLDTVFEPESSFQRFVRRGNVVEGPGVSDMKGGLVIMVAALRAMQAAGTLKDADITIVLTGDEEKAAKPVSISRRDLIEAAKVSDLALDFEGLAREGGKDMGSIARRSSNNWKLTVTAKSGHSSGIFSEGAGYGAIYEVSRILDGFRRELREPSATYNVGMVFGGAEVKVNEGQSGGEAIGKTNIIPAQAVALGDLRTLTPEQTKRMRDKMQAMVAKDPLAGTKAQFDFEEGYPPMAPSDGSRALLAELNAVNRDLGLDTMAELDPLKRGAGDIGFVADRLVGLNGMGAGGSGAHAPGETMDLDTLDRQTQRAAILMTRLSHPR